MKVFPRKCKNYFYKCILCVKPAYNHSGIEPNFCHYIIAAWVYRLLLMHASMTMLMAQSQRPLVCTDFTMNVSILLLTRTKISKNKSKRSGNWRRTVRIVFHSPKNKCEKHLKFLKMNVSSKTLKLIVFRYSSEVVINMRKINKTNSLKWSIGQL